MKGRNKLYENEEKNQIKIKNITKKILKIKKKMKREKQMIMIKENSKRTQK